MTNLKLYMLLVGCKPPGRNTEQHDIFFAIGESVKAILPMVRSFWKDAKTYHIDAWREVNYVDGYKVICSGSKGSGSGETKLFFINLGGYKHNEFDEFHYKVITAATDKGKAIAAAKQTAFYKHYNAEGSARSHVDDKYGIDVDDFYEIADILPDAQKNKYFIQLVPSDEKIEDEIFIGYFKPETFE